MACAPERKANLISTVNKLVSDINVVASKINPVVGVIIHPIPRNS
jgi:hypothetical protein